jgi:hypothetical protein
MSRIIESHHGFVAQTQAQQKQKSDTNRNRHETHHVGLLLDRAVVVDHANSALRT